MYSLSNNAYILFTILINLTILISKEVRIDNTQKISRRIVSERRAKEYYYDDYSKTTATGSEFIKNKMIPDSPEAIARRIMQTSRQKRGGNHKLKSSYEQMRPIDHVGYEIGTLRRKKNISIEELASRVGISPITLTAIELGQASAEEVIRNLDTIGNTLGNRKHLLRVLLSQVNKE